MKKSKAYTLLELLLVIAMIAILTAIVIVAVNPTVQLGKSRDADRKVEVSNIKNALDQYYLENREYPTQLPNASSYIDCGDTCAICREGRHEGSGGACSGLNLDALVPDYLAEISPDPTNDDADYSGYYTYVDSNNGEVVVVNPTPENEADVISTSRPVVSSEGDFAWVNAIGASSADFGHSVTTDADDNVIITGYFVGAADFDPGAGEEILTAIGYSDLFLAKYSTNGSLLWAINIGAPYNDVRAYSVATDPDGNIYFTGKAGGLVDFDAGAGTANFPGNGPFITKYMADGTYGGWTKRLINSQGSMETARSIAADSSGNVYVASDYSHTVDFDTGAGTDNRTSSNNSPDVYLTKYSNDGTYQWTKTFGGTGYDTAYTIATSNNSIYVAGTYTGSVDFDPGAGTDNRSANDSRDAFFAKYSTDGTYQWAKTFGGNGYDEINSIATGPSGEIVLAGHFMGSTDFNPETGTDTHNVVGNADIFLSRYNNSGGYSWTKTFGGANWDSGTGVTLDSSGVIYITGSFDLDSVDFDPSSAEDIHAPIGYTNFFVSQFTAIGSFNWAKTFGSTTMYSGSHYSKSITTDSLDDIYLTGSYYATTDFDPESGTQNRTSEGDLDIFLLKLE